jgi:hypothetical protein
MFDGRALVVGGNDDAEGGVFAHHASLLDKAKRRGDSTSTVAILAKKKFRDLQDRVRSPATPGSPPAPLPPQPTLL